MRVLVVNAGSSSVKLRVLHSGREQPIDYELARATIPLETVLGDARGKDGKWVYYKPGMVKRKGG